MDSSDSWRHVSQEGANVYSILQRDVLVLTQGAAAAVAERTLAPVHRTPARLRRGPKTSCN